VKYSIKDQVMDGLCGHIKCSGDDLSDIADDVLKQLRKGFIERLQEITNDPILDHKEVAQQLMHDILKEIKCDLCYLRFDCSVVYDPEECALEVSSNHKDQTKEEKI
jgi:hypothetical protein